MRLIAKTRGFRYPVGADSLRLVREAGGLSKLTPEQLATVTFKRVEVGEDCSDMPAESVASRIARGEIERVDGPAAAPATKKTRRT
jgi:hypothetical protein